MGSTLAARLVGKQWVLAILVCTLLLFVAYFAGADMYHSFRIERALAACENDRADVQEDCVFLVIENEVQKGGIAAGFDVFSRAYHTFKTFAEGGCHTRSHRMGDIAYYKLYAGEEDITAIDFPQETTACGYGFFHGFLEHYAENHPTGEAITGMCSYLIDTLQYRMRDIDIICYHGAGHGLMLAQLKNINESEYGNSAAFVTNPADACRTLPKATRDDIEQCYEGIFNILVNFMVAKDYGFAYDDARPFSICDEQPQSLRQACVYEMAQKLDSLSKHDPQKLMEIVSQLPEPDLQTLAFGVGIAGIMQQVVASADAYNLLLDECAVLPDVFFQKCVRSIIGGLYEHGEPQREYIRALALCADDTLQTRDMRSTCYGWVAEKLPRFYDAETMQKICPEFPEAHRSKCIDALAKKLGKNVHILAK